MSTKTLWFFVYPILKQIKTNKTRTAVIAVLFLSFIAHNIRKSGPHHKTAYILTRLFQQPNVKSGGSKINDPKFNKIKEILKDFIKNGQDVGTQISLYVNHEEKLNYYAVDRNRFPFYNENSLHTIFSSTKNITALLISIAINNK